MQLWVISETHLCLSNKLQEKITPRSLVFMKHGTVVTTMEPINKSHSNNDYCRFEFHSGLSLHVRQLETKGKIHFHKVVV